MDVEKYLDRRSESLERETKRIKDFKVFDFAFVPAKLLVRDEAKYLIDAMLKYARTGIPQNLVLLGSRGCGKTLLLRHLQRVLSARLDLQVLYANCRNQNTSFKILAGLLGAPLRGTSLQELYTRFEERYEGRTVVVLDEVDLISKKDPNKDILYFLSRSEKSYMVICLSNNPRVINELDVSIRSSLQAEVHYLQNYDANQVAEILQMRAQAGLRSWDEGELAKIAALAVQRTNSDIRVAIKTLFYAVTDQTSDIEASFDHAQRDIFIDLISDLNDRNLLILKAVQKSAEILVRRIFDVYERISDGAGVSAFSYPYYMNNLAYRQSLGLIVLAQTKVNRTYAYTAELLFNPDVLNTVYRMRFG